MRLILSESGTSNASRDREGLGATLWNGFKMASGKKVSVSYVLLFNLCMVTFIFETPIFTLVSSQNK